MWGNDLFKDTFINSIFITLISIVLSITIALFAAYALKRYQIRFKTAFMQWLLLAYMLPEFLFVLPMFTIYQTIGLYDTYLGMAIIYQVHVLPFSIWMLRSFLEEIPKEIDDAAIIDGCGPLQAIFRIYLSSYYTGNSCFTAILNGIWVWNELAIALGLTFFDAQPITVGVASFRGYASIDWGGMTGSAIISMIPMVLLLLSPKSTLSKGLTLGSEVKRLIMSKQYDFIIVGGGTSGIITASKLVEQGASVLVLEEAQEVTVYCFLCLLVG